jgi:hypothetical protein
LGSGSPQMGRACYVVRATDKGIILQKLFSLT